MAWVKYPYHVKHDGCDYKPGELIEIADPAGHKLRGAEVVEAPVQSVEKPVARRGRKPEKRANAE